MAINAFRILQCVLYISNKLKKNYILQGVDNLHVGFNKTWLNE